jgi:hypothetical protein
MISNINFAMLPYNQAYLRNIWRQAIFFLEIKPFKPPKPAVSFRSQKEVGIKNRSSNRLLFFFQSRSPAAASSGLRPDAAKLG